MKPVIGLEVHVELPPRPRFLFLSHCLWRGAEYPHSPVCTGMPGSLPVLNKQVVEYALAVGLAANCQINQYCRFDRKNYFIRITRRTIRFPSCTFPYAGMDGWR